MSTSGQTSSRRLKVGTPTPKNSIPEGAVYKVAAGNATVRAKGVSKTKGGMAATVRVDREHLLNKIWALIVDVPSATGDKSRWLVDFDVPLKRLHGSVSMTSPVAHKLIMRGISPKTIAPLGDVLGVGVSSVASYLDIDRGTPARQESKGQPLPRHAAEGVLRLLEIESLAHETFEEGDSTGWLNRPHPMLDGETPLQAAGTSYGSEQVKSILVAIKYGGVV